MRGELCTAGTRCAGGAFDALDDSFGRGGVESARSFTIIVTSGPCLAKLAHQLGTVRQHVTASTLHLPSWLASLAQCIDM
jgi:hypothetical protein